MSEATTTTTATVSSKPAAKKASKKKPSAKKTSKKKVSAKKAPTSKSTAKKKTSAKKSVSAKKASTPRAKKEGLRKPQVRILQAFGKSTRPMTWKALSTTAAVDYSSSTSLVGSSDEAVRAKNDSRKFPSLLTLGYLVASEEDVDGRNTVVYSITKKGRTALKEAEKNGSAAGAWS